MTTREAINVLTVNLGGTAYAEDGKTRVQPNMGLIAVKEATRIALDSLIREFEANGDSTPDTEKAIKSFKVEEEVPAPATLKLGPPASASVVVK